MVFPVVRYGCESWTIRKAECWGFDAFKLWCWRWLSRVPWTARLSNQSILKEISPGCSLEGLMLKLKLQYSGHLIRRTDSLEKTLMLGRRQEDKGTTEDEMVGWHHRLDGREFEWNAGDSAGQGNLACFSPWGRKESDKTWRPNKNNSPSSLVLHPPHERSSKLLDYPNYCWPLWEAWTCVIFGDSVCITTSHDSEEQTLSRKLFMSTCTAVFLQGYSLSPSAVDSGMEELGGEGRRGWLVRTFGSISRGRKQGTETKLKMTTTAPRGLSFPLSKFSKTLSSLPVAVIGCLYWVTFSFHFYFLVTSINCEIIKKRKKKQKQGLPWWSSS